MTRKDVTGKHFIDWFFKIDDWWTNITPKQFPYSMIIHSNKFSVYGYFNDDKLDAIIRADELYNDYELSFFFVNKALQNQGVGQSLFNFILNKFTNKKLILYVYKDNSRAIHIYKKYGFKQTGIGYDGKGYRPDSPYYIMQRERRKEGGNDEPSSNSKSD